MSEVPPDYSMVYCDCAFSQPGGNSARVGKMAEMGFSAQELRILCASLQHRGIDATIVDLVAEAVDKGTTSEWLCNLMGDTVVLVIRNGANALTNDPAMADKMLQEHRGLEYDTTTLLRKKVCVARSRRNLHFADEGRPEDMANGQNTVVPWSSVPANAECRRVLTELLETTDVASAVANYYPDPAKCGIGWHGDAERRQTIMVRLGAGSDVRPIHFLWCERGEAVAAPITINLKHGDVMVPCAKAVGTDYRTMTRPTVRHGTGYPSGTSVLLTPPAVARPPKKRKLEMRRERGVDLGPFAKSEIQEYVDTGPMGGKDALRARAELLERRGGVLPTNWTVAEHYKANLELMESIRIRGRGGD